MSHKNITKNGRRFVLYISEDLRAEINTWVKRDGVSLADFTREALNQYLLKKRHEARNAELAQTCRLLANWDESAQAFWQGAPTEKLS